MGRLKAAENSVWTAGFRRDYFFREGRRARRPFGPEPFDKLMAPSEAEGLRVEGSRPTHDRKSEVGRGVPTAPLREINLCNSQTFNHTLEL